MSGDALELLHQDQAQRGVSIDALTNLCAWDQLFPLDYDRIVEVAGGWA